MQFILNAVNEKSGVKAVVVLLIISSLIFAYSLVAMGAPGITYGDINEDDEIDVRDVVRIMRYILDLETLTEDQLTAADVTGDGEVDVRDATKIMQFALGLIDEFPVYLKVDSVEAIEITVSSGTAYADIDFPDTVKAALYNETEKDIDVEWGEESDPEYDPSISGSYEFEGELVDLPDGVTNPEEIMASATVKVQYRYIPPRRDPDPDPATPDLSNLDIAGQNDDATIFEGDEEDISVEVENIGDEEGSFTIELELEISNGSLVLNVNGGSESRSTDTATLGPGETETVTFDNVTGDLAVGDYDVVVADEDDISSVEGSLAVKDEPFTVTFIERRGQAASIAVYEDEEREQQVSSTLEASEGEAEKNLVNNDYWFTASAADAVYDDYEGDFEVDGEDKTIEFLLGPSEYEFNITDESPACHVYNDFDNSEIDAAYSVYAVESYTTSPSDYVYNSEGHDEPTDYVYAEDVFVEFKAVFEGTEGYEDAKFEFDITHESDEPDDIFFKADNGVEFEIDGGSIVIDDENITIDYSAKWLLMFKEAKIEDYYEVNFSLLDNEEEIIRKTVRFYLVDEPLNNSNN